MTDDLISRADVIEMLNEVINICPPIMKGCEETRNSTLEEAIDIVAILPSADRPQGEWIINYAEGIKLTKCSACGVSFTTYDVYGWNYCPWCGARMKGADDGTR